MLLMIIVIKVLLLWYLCDKPGPYIAFREEGILDNTGKKTFSSLLLSPEDRFLNLFQPTFSKVHVTSWNRILLSISINFDLQDEEKGVSSDMASKLPAPSRLLQPSKYDFSGLETPSIYHDEYSVRQNLANFLFFSQS